MVLLVSSWLLYKVAQLSAQPLQASWVCCHLGALKKGHGATFDLCDHMDLPQNAGAPSARDIANNEEHHVVNQSDGEKHEDYMDDDDDSFSTTSSLSIPNESIDFDLVYALHSFAATVEGQANVVKGDSLFLMDDSNSYWWLVRVLKTQEVGYIPAENIETPFERLGRLNRHRNVDVTSISGHYVQLTNYP